MIGFRRRMKSRTRGQNEADSQRRVTRLNRVPIMQLDRRDRLPVDVRSVRTVQIEQPTERRVDLDEKVIAREELVLGGKSKLHRFRPPHNEVVVPIKSKFAPGMRPVVTVNLICIARSHKIARERLMLFTTTRRESPERSKDWRINQWLR